ncbi:MAG: zinc ribbon domain-containing protein [Roseburia sp.]|nr:zinc ribbon domain-containing protein [Roseburia sp.]MCM1557340.1 zinc ribbon domain-containing protein [Anaeroplasma bactoclasticum]
MKYCNHCGAEIADEAVVCVKCGCSVETKTVTPEGSVLGILSIVFGAFGGWLGLVLGIIGLCMYKEPNNRKKCKVGIGLFIGWVVILIILIAAVH